MFYFILKIIFKIALRIFFREIEVRNRHLIPADGPLLIAANHPNTFMDPIAIASVVKSEVYFLAKSTVFNSAFNKWLLHKMNLIPVYRREDGPVTEAGNDQTFRKCFEFLAQRGTLLIFPEGNSFNERRLRPLKTGTARLALGAEAQADFQAGVRILPVGLNYSNPTQFRSKLYINIGAPILVSDYAEKYTQDAFKAAQELTADLKHQLEALIVISETDEEDELARQIEILYRHDLQKAFNLGTSQEDQFVLTKSILESIRYFRVKEPAWVQVLQKRVNGYIQELNRVGLQDKQVQISKNRRLTTTQIIQTTIFIGLGWPLYVWGIITNYLPYLLPSKIADRLTHEQEFRAPIMMTAGIFTFPLWYVLLIYLFYTGSGLLVFTALFALSLPLSGFFALGYNYRLAQTQGFLKVYTLLFRRQEVIKALWQERAALITELEGASERYRQHLQANTPEELKNG